MGRPTGTPNKRKAHLLAQLRKLYPEYHPVLEMAKIAMEKGEDGEFVNDIHLRANMNKEIAQYVEPKRKAIEHSGEIGVKDASECTDEELLAIIEEGSSTRTTKQANSKKVTH